MLIAAGAPDARADVIRRGGSFGELKFGEATGKPEPNEPHAPGNAKSAEHFVLAESAVLAHHVGETLLRLYIAHESLPPCPALELARVRAPAKFRQMVRARFIETNTTAFGSQSSKVFQLVADPAGLRPEPDKEMWWASVDNVEVFLRHFASEFLDSGLYNSAKHGMALTPTEFGFAYGDSQLTRHRGPAIYHIEQKPDGQTGDPKWFGTYRWIRPDQQAAMTFMGIKLIRGLWRMARVRYTQREVKGAEFSFFDTPRFDQLLAPGNDTGVTWTAMSMQMMYWADADHSADESSG